MLSQRVKPYKIKWIEAERELATRGFFPKIHSIGHEHLPIESEHRLPPLNKIFDPKKAIGNSPKK